MRKITLVVPALILIVNSCNQPNNSATSPTLTTTETIQVKESSPKAEQIAELVKVIDKKRTAIETGVEQVKPIELKTNKLREQIKQKWVQIHFYKLNESVVRIKTYPYANITKRTEEFYFENGQLILAVIEDNGEGEKGKESSEFSKLYYFQDDKLLFEKNNSLESETSLRGSDAERLLQETKEYVGLLK